MKLYLSGPMSEIPNNNYPLFNKMEKELRIQGYRVFNPAKIVLKEYPKNYVPKDEGDARKVWEAYMRVCIAELTKVDAVAYLDGWSRSKGATIEVNLAHHLGMDMAHAELWLLKKHRV